MERGHRAFMRSLWWIAGLFKVMQTSVEGGRSGSVSSVKNTRFDATVMIADISGSTGLYRQLGDVRARQLIHSELDRLRAIIEADGGYFIRDKGDDVLAYFRDPPDGLRAAQSILAPADNRSLTIHMGLHFGPIETVGGDIFGDVVNIASRLTALANGGEAWISGDLVAQLRSSERATVRPLGKFPLKGVDERIDVYSLVCGDIDMHTRLPFATTAGELGRAADDLLPSTVLLLSRNAQSVRCREGERIHIGRSDSCDIRYRDLWVSRNHAVVEVRDSKAVLQDTSSVGTHVVFQGGPTLFLRRESMVLTGVGVISPSVEPSDPTSKPLTFEVI